MTIMEVKNSDLIDLDNTPNQLTADVNCKFLREPSSISQLTDAKTSSKIKYWDDIYKARGMTHRVQVKGMCIWMRNPTIEGIERAINHKRAEKCKVQKVKL